MNRLLTLGVALLAFNLAACKPVVVPPLPLAYPNAAVAVDDTGAAVANATCMVDGNTNVTNADGYTLFAAVLAGQRNMVCSAVNHSDGSTFYLNDRAQNVYVKLARVAPPYVNMMPRLAAEGQHFTANGPFTAIESSDFTAYQHFLDGQDITPVLEQRASAGFNMLRVFGMYNGSLGRFIPAEYGDTYYNALPAFYTLLSRYNLYGEFVAFADAPAVIPEATIQVEHWQRLQLSLVSPNVLLELGNELDQVTNRLLSINLLNRPTAVFSSHGSNGSQAWPVGPNWDYATFHTNDAPEWRRKVGHNAMEIWLGPTLSNENTRAPDRFSSLQEAFDAAAGAALLAGGSDYHSVNGKGSQLWTGLELDLAQAWAAGAASVPLDCQRSLYRHRSDLEVPGVLRAYQRGDSPACVVLIH